MLRLRKLLGHAVCVGERFTFRGHPLLPPRTSATSILKLIIYARGKSQDEALNDAFSNIKIEERYQV